MPLPAEVVCIEAESYSQKLTEVHDRYGPKPTVPSAYLSLLAVEVELA